MLVQRAVSERWQIETRDGNRVQIVLEIGREGEIRGLAVEKSSGDPLYDEAALRAITEATPFPPFPDDFKEFLRVHLEFTSSGNTPVK
jgi:TonB family protein